MIAITTGGRRWEHTARTPGVVGFELGELEDRNAQREDEQDSGEPRG